MRNWFGCVDTQADNYNRSFQKGRVFMRLLVAEDDPRLGPSLKKGLEKHHYAVDLVANGEDALLMGRTIPYDLIVLVLQL